MLGIIFPPFRNRQTRQSHPPHLWCRDGGSAPVPAPVLNLF